MTDTGSKEVLDNLCSTRELADLYRDGTYLENNQSWHVEDSSWKAQQIERMLNRNNLNPLTVCEVGCGAGEILKQLSLKTEHTEYFGFELSPQAFELCKTRAGNRLHYLFKNILDENVYYESLLCIDVFEHVEDYFGLIRGLKSKATYKIFHVPLDISSLSVTRGLLMRGRKSVGHIHYFTRESALATLEDCGYEILDESYTLLFDYLTEKSVKGKILQFVQRRLFKLSPHFTVRLLGGCSLLVLAK
jgi:hypothetical protein